MTVADLVEVFGMFAVVWVTGYVAGIGAGMIRRIRDVV